MIKKVMALMLTAATTLTMLSGCGTKAPANTVSPETKTEVTEKTDKKIGVVLIVNTNLGDKSFCDLSYEGLKKAQTDLNLNIKVVELGGDATKQIPTFTEFAEDPEWDIIISGTYNVKESLQTVASEYPDKKFILYDAKVDYDKMDLKNVYSVEHLQNEGSFLVGAAAAILSESGKEGTNAEKVIGFVGGGENTAINDFLVGYIQGAQYIDSNSKVLISYIGDFKDSAKGKEMSLAQISQGADVIFGVAGGAGLGVLDGAKEKNAFAIGVDKDQAVALEANDPVMAARIATSMVKNVDKTVYNAVKATVEGTAVFGTSISVGLKEGSVGMAKNKFYDEIFTTEQKTKLDEIEKKVASGEIKVQTAIGMTNETLKQIKNDARP